MSGNVFLGRTIAQFDDLSPDEIWYLYQKTRELKTAIYNNDRDVIERFRINDPHFGMYVAVLENSTRTKESSVNAGNFHGIKVNKFEGDSSSLKKGEAFSDTFKMLWGNRNDIFIVRSTEEGLCRWLDTAVSPRAAKKGRRKPVFINAGDGKHQHPTQEFLDQYTFLEKSDFDISHIHLAIIGDLKYGRTVHSKPEGLSMYREVEVDLVAPQELAMPKHYLDRMIANGFKVNLYDSLEEYYSQPRIAKIQYFTRLQMERFGDDLKKLENILRSKTTFREEWILKQPEGTCFYHPLPRYKPKPELPFSLDNTDLNGWDDQAENGLYLREALISCVAGIAGSDFDGEPYRPREFVEDFITEAGINSDGPKNYCEGLRPITNGISIDHICKGEDIEAINDHITKIKRIVGLKGLGGQWVGHSKSDGKYKGLIFGPNMGLSESEIKMLAAVSPRCTLNVIRDGNVIKKVRLSMPPRIYGLDDLACKNEGCIANPAHLEPVVQEFYRVGDHLECKYCETPHTFKEIWKE